MTISFRICTNLICLTEAMMNTQGSDATSAGKSLEHLQQSWPYPTHALSRRKIIGGINGGLINDATVKSLEFKRDIFFPFSLLVHNTMPIGHQDFLQFLFTTMLLADLAVTLLTLIQFYWISLGAFLAVLLILPLSLLSPSPAGLNALFSKEPRRASHTRIYSLWNATSLTNIVSSSKFWVSATFMLCEIY
ncbi:hypothetical protein Golax_006329 [Gossypium laxum]|uniref:Uncharacterized protein n=1 Tax=Gossypium laxum TaxID=34288 RepID=A0A7J9A4Y3_9ROSI|nr:hypothetical protein [Gossypium laxum]